MQLSLPSLVSREWVEIGTVNWISCFVVYLRRRAEKLSGRWQGSPTDYINYRMPVGFCFYTCTCASGEVSATLITSRSASAVSCTAIDFLTFRLSLHFTLSWRCCCACQWFHSHRDWAAFTRTVCPVKLHLKVFLAICPTYLYFNCLPFKFPNASPTCFAFCFFTHSAECTLSPLQLTTHLLRLQCNCLSFAIQLSRFPNCFQCVLTFEIVFQKHTRWFIRRICSVHSRNKQPNISVKCFGDFVYY